MSRGGATNRGALSEATATGGKLRVRHICANTLCASCASVRAELQRRLWLITSFPIAGMNRCSGIKQIGSRCAQHITVVINSDRNGVKTGDLSRCRSTRTAPNSLKPQRLGKTRYSRESRSSLQKKGRLWKRFAAVNAIVNWERAFIPVSPSNAHVVVR